MGPGASPWQPAQSPLLTLMSMANGDASNKISSSTISGKVQENWGRHQREGEQEGAEDSAPLRFLESLPGGRGPRGHGQNPLALQAPPWTPQVCTHTQLQTLVTAGLHGPLAGRERGNSELYQESPLLGTNFLTMA